MFKKPLQVFWSFFRHYLDFIKMFKNVLVYYNFIIINSTSIFINFPLIFNMVIKSDFEVFPLVSEIICISSPLSFIRIVKKTESIFETVF